MLINLCLCTCIFKLQECILLMVDFLFLWSIQEPPCWWMLSHVVNNHYLYFDHPGPLLGHDSVSLIVFIEVKSLVLVSGSESVSVWMSFSSRLCHGEYDAMWSQIFTLSHIHGYVCHTCHISLCEIKSHRIWPIWKPVPIRLSNLTDFSDHLTIHFMKKWT